MKPDLQLQQDVMDELLWDPSLESAEIGATPGVVDVKDELIIAP